MNTITLIGNCDLCRGWIETLCSILLFSVVTYNLDGEQAAHCVGQAPGPVDYQHIATTWRKDLVGEKFGPGSLLVTLENAPFYRHDLKRFKVNTAEDAIRIAKEKYYFNAPKLEDNELLVVSDLKSWKADENFQSYAWCVSRLWLDGSKLYPRVKNRVWVSAASGSVKPMRTGVRLAEPIKPSTNVALPVPHGDLLPTLGKRKALFMDLEQRLRESQVPLPKKVIQWEKEQRGSPTQNRFDCPYVYMLIELAGDCEYLGKDGDLVWVLHNGPGSHGFDGEEWINTRTGESMSFSTKIWGVPSR